MPRATFTVRPLAGTTFGAVVTGSEARRALRRGVRGALPDLARARPADLPGPAPDQGRAGRLRPALRRAGDRARADQQRARATARCAWTRTRRRRREGAEGQHGLARGFHLHAGPGQGRGVLGARDAGRGRRDRVGRHAGGLRRAGSRRPRADRGAAPTTP